MVKEENTIDKQALLEEFERESRTRNFVNPIFASILKWTALLITLYHLAYASGYIRPETLRHRGINNRWKKFGKCDILYFRADLFTYARSV